MNQECNSGMEGSLHPVVNDCSKYYSCSRSYISIFTCPSGFFFDPTYQKCNLARKVSCSASALSSTGYFYQSTRPTFISSTTRYTFYLTPLSTKYNNFIGNLMFYILNLE